MERRLKGMRKMFLRGEIKRYWRRYEGDERDKEMLEQELTEMKEMCSRGKIKRCCKGRLFT